MIVVLCSYQVNPDDRDDWVAARRDQVTRTQSEDGCFEYRMSVDAFDPGTVVLVERWRDDAALAEHMKVVEANKAAGGGPATPPTLSRSATVFEAEVLREIAP